MPLPIKLHSPETQRNAHVSKKLACAKAFRFHKSLHLGKLLKGKVPSVSGMYHLLLETPNYRAFWEEPPEELICCLNTNLTFSRTIFKKVFFCKIITFTDISRATLLHISGLIQNSPPLRLDAESK